MASAPAAHLRSNPNEMSTNSLATDKGGVDLSDSGYRSDEHVHRFVTPGGHPQDNSQPALPVYRRKFGNPAPLGLSRKSYSPLVRSSADGSASFAATTFLLSMFNLQARHITIPT